MGTIWDTIFVKEIGFIHKERTYDGKTVETNIIEEEFDGWYKVTSTELSNNKITVTYYSPRFIVLKR